MKRFLMMLAFAAVAGAMYVAAAPGSQTAKGPTAAQFNALKKQVTTLSATVTTLNSKVSALKTTVMSDDGFINDCLITGGAAPVSEFGDNPNGGTVGYEYNDGTDPVFLSTALDFDGSPTPQAFFQVIDSSCVTVSGVHHAGGLSEQRQTSFAARAR